jgi:hypothetical protein
MCRNWISMTGEVRAQWGIPQDQFTELAALFTAVLLEKAQSSDRTPKPQVEADLTFPGIHLVWWN